MSCPGPPPPPPPPHPQPLCEGAAARAVAPHRALVGTGQWGDGVGVDDVAARGQRSQSGARGGEVLSVNDLFLVPTMAETFFLGAAEALAAGAPRGARGAGARRALGRQSLATVHDVDDGPGPRERVVPAAGITAGGHQRPRRAYELPGPLRH